jgi:hypothetical protein
MTLGASGASSLVETVQLFTMEEAMTAMTKAGQIQKTTTRQLPDNLRLVEPDGKSVSSEAVYEFVCLRNSSIRPVTSAGRSCCIQ